MLIRIYSKDIKSNVELLAETEVNALALMVGAESREDEARMRGSAWTAGAVAFFAAQLIAAVKSGKPRKVVDVEATNVGMAAWLSDSIYDLVTAELFMQSDLNFTVMPTGAVKYDRVVASVVTE